jgi:hypothetical protein
MPPTNAPKMDDVVAQPLVMLYLGNQAGRPDIVPEFLGDFVCGAMIVFMRTLSDGYAPATAGGAR